MGSDDEVDTSDENANERTSNGKNWSQYQSLSTLNADGSDNTDSFNKNTKVLSAYGDNTNHQRSLKSSSADSPRKPNWSKKFYSSGKTDTALLMALYVSRRKGYFAGKILEIHNIPSIEQGGPSRVKVNICVFPHKMFALRSEWYSVLNQKALCFQYYKYNFRKPEDLNDEKQLRIRVYGTRNTFGSMTRCVGECFIDLNDIPPEKGNINYWINLLGKADGCPDTP